MEIAIGRLVTAWIAGHDSAHKLTRHLYPSLKPNTREFDHFKNQIAPIVKSPVFQNRVFKAKKDILGTVIQDFKDTAPAYKAVLDELVFGDTDASTKGTLVKTGLVFAGLAPSQKITVFTPKDYEDKLEAQGLIKPEVEDE